MGKIDPVPYFLVEALLRKEKVFDREFELVAARFEEKDLVVVVDLGIEGGKKFRATETELEPYIDYSEEEFEFDVEISEGDEPEPEPPTEPTPPDEKPAEEPAPPEEPVKDEPKPKAGKASK